MSVVLLSGGVGKRMKASMPKQYLDLRGKVRRLACWLSPQSRLTHAGCHGAGWGVSNPRPSPVRARIACRGPRPQPIATWSLGMFAGMAEVGEVVVVCAPEYEEVFASVPLPRAVALKFARPGKERQDSVFSGLQAVAASAALVAVHDSARPLVREEDVRRCMEDAMQHGAAVLGVPVKVSKRRGSLARRDTDPPRLTHRRLAPIAADDQGGGPGRHGRQDAGPQPSLGCADTSDHPP